MGLWFCRMKTSWFFHWTEHFRVGSWHPSLTEIIMLTPILPRWLISQNRNLFSLGQFCNTGRPGFIALHRYCVFFFFFFFNKLKVCGNPVSSKSLGTIFPTAFAYFVSLCHTLVIRTVFQTLSLWLYVWWYPWPMTFDVTTTARWRLRGWWASFSSNLFLN